MEYGYPILIFLGMGILFGVLLTVASKVFAVKTDERVEKITELLPGANCGACGFAGCADYADAVVNKGAAPNACLPGGAKAAAGIGEVMGTTVEAQAKQVPVLHCQGTCNVTKQTFAFQGGTLTCASAKRYYGGNGSCLYGCLGYGDCAAVCPEGCITLQDGIATFCTETCISCGKCAKACPNQLISLRSEKKKVDVRCSSHDMGKAAMQACEKSCIGCKKCEKVCPKDAIHVENFLAVLDYDKCVSCGLCVKECPKGCIMNLRVPKKAPVPAS